MTFDEILYVEPFLSTVTAEYLMQVNFVRSLIIVFSNTILNLIQIF